MTSNAGVNRGFDPDATRDNYFSTDRPSIRTLSHASNLEIHANIWKYLDQTCSINPREERKKAV